MLEVSLDFFLKKFKRKIEVDRSVKAEVRKQNSWQKAKYARLYSDLLQVMKGQKVNSSDEGERGTGETGGGEGRNTNSYTEIGQKKKTDPFSLSNPL